MTNDIRKFNAESIKILISPTTVEAALATMVRNGVVDKVGSGKNTKYVKR